MLPWNVVRLSLVDSTGTELLLKASCLRAASGILWKTCGQLRWPVKYSFTALRALIGQVLMPFGCVKG